MSQRTNEADIAAVTEVVRAYYDGMIEGDAAKLGRAFHPRASIVGNEGGTKPVIETVPVALRAATTRCLIGPDIDIPPVKC